MYGVWPNRNKSETLLDLCTQSVPITYFSTAGVEFFSLVKSLAKRYGNKKNLHFMWVDPDPFPTVS